MNTLKDHLIVGVFVGSITIGILALICVPWVISSKIEAQAFNRATGANVSTWDAMWVELRIQAQPEVQK